MENNIKEQDLLDSLGSRLGPVAGLVSTILIKP
jgi:hypothetical protein